MTQYPSYMGLGASQGQSRRVQKILTPLWFDPWTIQYVTSHYTDYYIPVH
jgi:hypothetical protein